MLNKESLKAGIGAGFFGSLCCTVPVLIVGLGLGSIGFALGFAKYRPFFIILGVVFLVFALYKYIKRKEGVCNVQTLRKNLITIVTAIVVAIIVWAILIYVVAPLLGKYVYG
jgi:hypothetical protein